MRNTRHRNIFALLIVATIGIFWWNKIFAHDIVNFSNYKAEEKNIESVSRTKLLYAIKKGENMKCSYTMEKKDTYIIDPICLVQNDLPKIWFTEAIDYLWPYIQWFNSVYNDISTIFSYEGTSPIFKQDYEILPKNIQEKYILITIQEQGKKIRIHKSSLAYQTIKNANFFTVYKDTSLLKNCTSKNYNVALQRFNGILFWPGEIFNVNKMIMNLPGYCKWSWRTDLLFYGGVCGFATQLFRTSLLIPQIEVTKRYGHNEWIVPYYYDYIFWDDAALYEMSKQLEIKNNSEYNMYFKVLEVKKGNYFVIIIPEKNNQWVTIKKNQTQQLGAKLEREIYETSSDIVTKKENFISKYTKKTYNRR